MATSTERQTITPSEADINQLWGQLSPPHQQLVLEIVQVLAQLDVQSQDSQDKKNRGAIFLMMLARRLEYEAMSPEERAQAEEEWEEFKATMNSNRAPEPPLFP